MSELVDLSCKLGFAPQHIFALVAASESCYFEVRIPKKKPSSGTRLISIPTSQLKGVQKSILHNILSEVSVSEHAHAYRKNYSVIGAAKKLSGDFNVLKIDIRDFFPSISAKRVFGVFAGLGYGNATSFILTKLTTYQGSLCQGAPTSPAISNIVCRQLDKHLSELANRHELSYLRYSDDIFVYGPKKFNVTRVLDKIDDILMRNGFARNDEKTRFFPRGKPRFTLGLQTSGAKPKLSRRQRRIYRAAFHRSERYPSWTAKHHDQLLGMAEWYRCVYGPDEEYRSMRATLRSVRAVLFHEVFEG